MIWAMVHVKIMKKIVTPLSANVCAYVPHARSVSLTRKSMAALSKLLLQMVTHLHTGSHVKPQRVKMFMQMRAGRKEHKNNGCHHSVFFSSCVGHKLISEEAAVGLKRWELSNTKGRCWLVIADFCSWETRWQLYLIQYKNMLYDSGEECLMSWWRHQVSKSPKFSRGKDTWHRG